MTPPLNPALARAVAQWSADERNRILAGLDALLRETAALWFEGTAPTKAVAAYTAAVRRVVEGGKS